MQIFIYVYNKNPDRIIVIWSGIVLQFAPEDFPYIDQEKKTRNIRKIFGYEWGTDLFLRQMH